MNSQVFDIDKFNIIQDDENYYFFRALNRADHKDISENITSNENGLQRIRTDRERFEEENENAKYTADSEISLEEVWDHIKIRYIKETNCISLSSNTNVSIDYGQVYNEEYVMIKVPKQDKEKVYNAGQYMLEEIDKIVQDELSRIPEDSDIWDIIRKIDDEKSSKSVRTIVADAYDGVKSKEGRFTNKGNKLRTKTAIVSRLDRRQYFTEEQQLEYNKIIAKLTVLETRGYLRSILPTKADNSSLIGTVGIAFSSGELIHYKDIQSEDMVRISKEMMDILSLMQQLRDKGIRDDVLKSLEIKVLGLINGGYKFLRQGEQLVLENGIDVIPIKEIDISIDKEEIAERKLRVEDVYQITKGKISYQKAKIAIEFANRLSRSRLKAIDYADIIKVLADGNEELAKLIKEECYAIDKDIINREEHEGYKIAESVNVGLSKAQRRFISNKEQLELIRVIQELEPEKLQAIVKTNGLSIESYIIDNLLDTNIEISENQYFAEAIVDGLDVENIYQTITDEKRIITKEEKHLLVDKLMIADCKRLYNSFINAGIEHSDVSGYVINLLMNNGYKGIKLEELSKLEDLDEIIETNVKNRNLKSRVQALRFDKLLGIVDDIHIVPETEIRLRDYQQVAVDNINEIYEDKRFASVILPTGAGKSFVAMAEMMNFKNSNIIFMAPQTTILTQFQSHIIKNILKRKDVPIKDYSKVIEEAFPSLKMFCYETLSTKDEEWLASHDADFIILDELHRAGAKTWQPQIQSLIDNNPNAKILGMTATPIRDMDHKDMSKVLAEMTGQYTSSELIRKEHQATEMTLLDAMQDGLVVSPKIVTFDYTLGESQEYQQVKMMIDQEQDSEKKEELKRIYKEMTAIIKNSEKDGMSKILAENITKKDGRYIVFLPNNNTELSAEEYIQQEIEKVKEYFKEIDQEPETYYLLSGRKNAKRENAKALEAFETSNSEHIKLIFAIDMLNEGVHVDNINGEIMLRPISENSRILYQQQIGRCVYSLNPDESLADEDRPIIFDVYNNYLAQNMDREANRTNSTSDLQRLDAIVHWIEIHKGYIPDINSEDTKEARKAVTLKNIQKKYFKYIGGINNKSLSESELYEIQKIIELGSQIELWDMEIPERIISPGEKDIIRNTTFEVTGTQKEFVELFKKAKSIQRDRITNITDRIVVSDFETEVELELGKTKNSLDSILITDTIAVLDFLTEYGIEISNENISLDSTLEQILSKEPKEIRQIILQEIENIGLSEDFRIGENYNLVKEKFYKGRKEFSQFDIKDLRRYGLFETFIDSSTKRQTSVLNGEFIIKGPACFREINIKTGTEYDEEGYNIRGYNEFSFKRGCQYDDKGFDKNGIHKETNEKYDRYGFKIDCTYRETGERYDEFGFDIYGLHKVTNRKVNTYKFNRDGMYLEKNSKGSYENKGLFDRRGFDFRGINKYTGTILDENQYDRDGYFYELRDDGTFVKTDIKKNIEGKPYKKYDINGFNKYGEYRESKTFFDENGFDVYGNHEITKTRLNEYGFDRHGRYCEMRENGTYIVTDKKRNPEGYDRYGVNEHHFKKDGYYYEQDKQGKWKNTGKRRDPEGFGFFVINERGFGKDGFYYEKQDDGTWKNTGKERDPEGFDFDGINERGFGRDRFYYEKQDDGTWKNTGKKRDPNGLDFDNSDSRRFVADQTINNYGFDREGYYYEKQEDGTYINTELKYNPYGFDVDRRHRITGTAIDLRKFDIDGKCKVNGDSIYDKNGYKQDGTYMETGEMYHNGYNAFGVDDKGLDKSGKVPPEIAFTKEYVGYVFKYGKKGMDHVLNKWCPRQRTRYSLEAATEYENRKTKFIREKLGTAELMYPALKRYIAAKILTIQKEISQSEEKIKELEHQKDKGQEELEALRKQSAEQKEKLEYLSQSRER